MINKLEIEEYVDTIINDNKLRKVNNIYLSKRQIDILDKYKIEYKNITNIKELIFNVENYINENFQYEELSDLESLSQELSELSISLLIAFIIFLSISIVSS